MLLTDEEDDDDDDDDDDEEDEEKNGEDKVRFPTYDSGIIFILHFPVNLCFLSIGGGRSWKSAVGLGDAGARQDNLPKVMQPRDE